MFSLSGPEQDKRFLQFIMVAESKIDDTSTKDIDLENITKKNIEVVMPETFSLVADGRWW